MRKTLQLAASLLSPAADALPYTCQCDYCPSHPNLNCWSNEEGREVFCSYYTETYCSPCYPGAYCTSDSHCGIEGVCYNKRCVC